MEHEHKWESVLGSPMNRVTGCYHEDCECGAQRLTEMDEDGTTITIQNPSADDEDAA